MLRYVASSIANQYVGRYVDFPGFKTLTSELIEIENAVLKPSALASTGLPLTIKHGSIGRICVRIPGGLFALATGYTGVIRVEIDNVFLLVDKVVLAGAQAKDAYFQGKEADLELDASLYQQQMLELLDASLTAQGKDGTSASAGGILSQLQDAVIRNGQLEISNVHIRYEDSTSQPSAPFVVGLKFSKLLTEGTSTANASPVGDGLMNRRAQLSGLSIHWDPLSREAMIGNIREESDKVRAFHALSAKKGHLYVIEPLDTNLDLVWNSKNLPNVPFIHARLSMSQLQIRLCTEQYHGAIFLQSWLSDAKMKEMRKTRPILDSDWAKKKVQRRAMWKYVLGLVVAMKAKFLYRRRDVPVSIKELRQKAREYKAEYTKFLEMTRKSCEAAIKSGSNASQQPTSKNDAALIAHLRDLERPFIYMTIIWWRTQARSVFEEGIARELSKTLQKKQSSGSLSSFFFRSPSKKSLSGPSSPVSSIVAPGSEIVSRLTSTQLGSRFAEALSLSDSSVFLDCEATLDMARVLIARDNSNSIASIYFSGSATYLATRGKNWKAALIVPDISVKDEVTKTTHFPLVVGQKRNPNGEGSTGKSLLRLEIENHPRPNVDLRVSVVSKPLVFISSPELIRAMARFSLVPKAAASVRAEASASLSNLQSQIASETSNVIRNRLRADVMINIAAPVLVLPASICDPDSKCLVMQLGDVAFRSANAENEHAQRGRPSSITLDSNFDTWTLGVDNVAAFLQSGFVYVPSPDSLTKPQEPIIQPISLNLCVQTCPVNSRFRFQGQIPLLNVSLSISFVRHLQALQQVFESLMAGLIADSEEVQGYFAGSLQSAGIEEGDTAGVSVLADASWSSKQQESSSSSENALTIKNKLPDEIEKIVADFSVNEISLELYDVRGSSLRELALQQGLSDESGLASDFDHKPDLSISLFGLGLNARSGHTGGEATIFLTSVAVIDRYQTIGPDFEQIVYSEQIENTESLISVKIVYRNAKHLSAGEPPLFLDVVFHSLHVSCNPETVAALQLYYNYILRFFPLLTTKQTAPIKRSPTTELSTKGQTQTLLDSISKALDDDDDDIDDDTGLHVHTPTTTDLVARGQDKIQLKIHAALGTLRISLNSEKVRRKLATASISRFSATVETSSSGNRVSTSLGQLSMLVQALQADRSGSDYLMLSFSDGLVRFENSVTTMQLSADVKQLLCLVTPSSALPAALELGSKSPAATVVVCPVDISLNFNQDTSNGTQQRVVNASMGYLDVVVSFIAVKAAIIAASNIFEADLPRAFKIQQNMSRVESQISIQPKASSSEILTQQQDDTAIVKWDGLVVTILDDAIVNDSSSRQSQKESMKVEPKASAPALTQGRVEGVQLKGTFKSGSYNIDGTLKIQLDAWHCRSMKLQPLIMKPWNFSFLVKPEVQTNSVLPTGVRAFVNASSPLLLLVSDVILTNLSSGATKWTAAVAQAFIDSNLSVSSSSLHSPSSHVSALRMLSSSLVAPRLQLIDVRIPAVRVDLNIERVGDDSRPPRELLRLYGVGLEAGYDAHTLFEPAVNGNSFSSVGSYTFTSLKLTGLHILDRQGKEIGPAFEIIATSTPDKGSALSSLLSLQNDDSQLAAVSALHTTGGALLKMRLKNLVPNEGTEVPSSLRGLGRLFPAANTDIDISLDKMHVEWNTLSLLELAKIAVNMGDTKHSKVASDAVAAAKLILLPTDALIPEAVPASPPITPSVSAVLDTSSKHRAITFDLHVDARSVSFSANKEHLQRKVLSVRATDFYLQLQSFAPSPSDSITSEIHGRLGDVLVLDLTSANFTSLSETLGNPSGANNILFRRLVTAPPQISDSSSHSHQTSKAPPLIDFEVKSFDVIADVPASSIVSVRLRPMNLVYVNNLILETVDYITNGIFGVISAFSGTSSQLAPPFTAYEPASSLASRSRFSGLSVTVESPIVYVPSRPNENFGDCGGLELRIASIVLRNRLEDRPIIAAVTGTNVSTPGRADPDIEAAANVMRISAKSVELLSFSGPTNLFSTIVETSDVGVTVSMFQSALASRTSGMFIGVDLPPIELKFSDRIYAAVMSVVFGNLAASPPLMATEKASCLISRPAIERPKTYRLQSVSTACAICLMSFGKLRSRNRCEACGCASCLSCIAGQAWDEEAREAKTICKNCFVAFTSEINSGADKNSGNNSKNSSLLIQSVDDVISVNLAGEDDDGTIVRSSFDDASGQNISSNSPGQSVLGSDTPTVSTPFAYGGLDSKVGDPMRVSVSFDFLTVELSRITDTSTSPLASLRLLNTSVKFVSTPETSMNETTIEIRALRVLDDRSVSRTAATRAIIVPNMPELRISSMRSKKSQPQIRFGFSSSTGGASKVTVELRACDLNPNIPALLDIVDFFQPQHTPASKVDEEKNAASNETSIAEDVDSTARKIINLRLPSPKSEMDLNVTVEAMRIIIVQDERSEQSPALLLSVPALRLMGGLATSAAKKRYLAGINPAFITEHKVVPKPNSPRSNLAYSPGIITRGKLQDNKIELSLRVKNLSISRTQVVPAEVMTSEQLLSVAPAAFFGATNSMIQLWEHDSARSGLGNLDGPRIPIVSPFSIDVDYLSSSTSVTQVDLSKIINPASDVIRILPPTHTAAPKTPGPGSNDVSSSGENESSAFKLDRSVARRGLPIDNMVIRATSSSDIHISASRFDLDLSTAILKGWASRLGTPTTDIDEKGTEKIESKVDPNPRTLEAKRTPLFEVHPDWHPNDYEIVFPSDFEASCGLSFIPYETTANPQDDVQSGRSTNTTLLMLARATQEERNAAMAYSYDAGDGKGSRPHSQTAVELAGVYGRCDILVAVNGIPISRLMVEQGRESELWYLPGQALCRAKWTGEGDKRRVQLHSCRNTFVVRMRSFPITMSIQLKAKQENVSDGSNSKSAGVSLGLLSMRGGTQKRQTEDGNEALRVHLNSVGINFFGSADDLSGEVAVLLEPVRAMFEDDNWSKIGRRTADFLVPTRSFSREESRCEMVVSQALIRPLRTSILMKAELSVMAEVFNPTSISWEPLIESWGLQSAISMFDPYYMIDAQGALPIQYPSRIVSVFAPQPLQLVLVQNHMRPLLTALNSNFTDYSRASDEKGTASRLLAEMAVGELQSSQHFSQSDASSAWMKVSYSPLPPNAFPYIFRNDTGIWLELSLAADPSLFALMWGKQASQSVSSSGSDQIPSPPGAITVSKGALALAPGFEVGLAISLQVLRNMDGSGDDSPPVPNVRNLITVLAHGSKPATSKSSGPPPFDIDSIGTSARRVDLIDTVSNSIYSCTLCAVIVAAETSKIITLRASTLMQNHTSLTVEACVTNSNSATHIGTLRPYSELPIPLHSLAAGISLKLRPLHGSSVESKTTHDWSEGIPIAGRSQGASLCTSTVDYLPSVRFAYRGFYVNTTAATSQLASTRRLNVDVSESEILRLTDFCVAFFAPLRITNALPVRLMYRTRSIADGQGQLGHMQPGEVCEVFDKCAYGEVELSISIDECRWSDWQRLDVAQETVECQRRTVLLQTEGYTTSRPVELLVDSKVILPRKLYDVTSLNGPEVFGFNASSVTDETASSIGNKGGRLEVTISTPTWIVNLTGLPLTLGERRESKGSDIVPAAFQVRGASLVETVYENERLHIFAWGDPLPTERKRWSDDEGKREIRRESIDDEMSRTPGWKWMNEWTCGPWDYEAYSFDRFKTASTGGGHNFERDFKPGHIVRRRLWQRRRERDHIKPIISSTVASSAAIAGTIPHALDSIRTRLAGDPLGLRQSELGLQTGTSIGTIPAISQDSIVLLNPQDGLLFMRLGMGPWSHQFDINGNGEAQSIFVIGETERVTGYRGNECESTPGYFLSVSYEEAPSPFHLLSHYVVILPKVVIANATPEPLRYRQPGHITFRQTSEPDCNTEITIPPLSYAPLWFTNTWANHELLFSPECAKGGWSPPVPVAPPSDGSPAKDWPVKISIPGAPTYAMSDDGSITAIGTVVAGVSVRIHPDVPQGSLIVVTLQTHPCAPIRPPLEIISSTSNTDAINFFSKSLGADVLLSEKYRTAPSESATKWAPIVSRPFFAFVNHSSCILRFRQSGGVACYNWRGSRMGADEMNGYDDVRSLGPKFSKSFSFVQPGRVVTAGVSDAQVSRVLFEVGAANSSHDSTVVFGSPVDVDVSIFESPLIIRAPPSARGHAMAVLLKVCLYGATRKIVAYDFDPVLEKEDEERILTQSTVNLGVLSNFGGAISDSIDFGPGKDAISTSLDHINGVLSQETRNQSSSSEIFKLKVWNDSISMKVSGIGVSVVRSLNSRFSPGDQVEARKSNSRIPVDQAELVYAFLDNISFNFTAGAGSMSSTFTVNSAQIDDQELDAFFPTVLMTENRQAVKVRFICATRYDAGLSGGFADYLDGLLVKLVEADIAPIKAMLNINFIGRLVQFYRGIKQTLKIAKEDEVLANELSHKLSSQQLISAKIDKLNTNVGDVTSAESSIKKLLLYRAGRCFAPLSRPLNLADDRVLDAKSDLLKVLDNLLNGQKFDIMLARAFVYELNVGRLALSADYDNGGKVSSKSEYVKEVDELLQEFTPKDGSSIHKYGMRRVRANVMKILRSSLAFSDIKVAFKYLDRRRDFLSLKGTTAAYFEGIDFDAAAFVGSTFFSRGALNANLVSEGAQNAARALREGRAGDFIGNSAKVASASLNTVVGGVSDALGNIGNAVSTLQGKNDHVDRLVAGMSNSSSGGSSSGGGDGTPSRAQQSISKGATNAFSVIAKGVTGIVMKPIERAASGFESGGALGGGAGLVRGVLEGVAGVAAMTAAPLMLASGIVGGATEGLAYAMGGSTSTSSGASGRRRLPRAFYGNSSLRSYDEQDAALIVALRHSGDSNVRSISENSPIVILAKTSLLDESVLLLLPRHIIRLAPTETGGWMPRFCKEITDIAVIEVAHIDINQTNGQAIVIHQRSSNQTPTFPLALWGGGENFLEIFESVR